MHIKYVYILASETPGDFCYIWVAGSHLQSSFSRSELDLVNTHCQEASESTAGLRDHTLKISVVSISAHRVLINTNCAMTDLPYLD